MQHLPRAGKALARNLICCLFALAFTLPAQATDVLAWRKATSLKELIGDLDLWIDAHTDLERRGSAPGVIWISQAQVASVTGSKRTAHIETIRGLYDAESTTIWLVRPWSARDPHDVSVLLHELVHHRQAARGHWYCPGAQELPAYRAQQAWLAQMGLELDVNWIAIVLKSGCTPRDIHPD